MIKNNLLKEIEYLRAAMVKSYLIEDKKVAIELSQELDKKIHAYLLASHTNFSSEHAP